MIPQSYYRSSNYVSTPPPQGALYRQHRRAMPDNVDYYGRLPQYSYHDPGAEYIGRHHSHTTIHEPEATPAAEQQRRRIAVAVGLIQRS